MTRIPLLDALRALSGRSNGRFVAYLLGQLDATITGAQLVRRAIAGEVGRTDAVELMREIEHSGDHQRGLLVTELRNALVTPIDREDLFRLSGALDDILDNLRDFLRAWSLFEMSESPVIEPVIDTVTDALDDLRAAIAALGREPGSVAALALAAKKSGNATRRAYDVAVANLYRSGAVDADMLRNRDLLRRLDVVGLRFGTAADILSDAAVRRAEG